MQAAIGILYLFLKINLENDKFIPLSNNTVASRIGDIFEGINQQLFSKLHYRIFAI